ncbi:hypothetical protein ADEAN_000019100 [Angomonas deanei]|uniref:Uncharacterized protein n=1 Tax=Angomonas deanei TaxID=59799 RepID=A0A7G2BZ03_9TRYP|nr:hypothetical protein ADEAN_000019100 [Angomonas deanei]
MSSSAAQRVSINEAAAMHNSDLDNIICRFTRTVNADGSDSPTSLDDNGSTLDGSKTDIARFNRNTRHSQNTRNNNSNANYGEDSQNNSASKIGETVHPRHNTRVALRKVLHDVLINIESLELFLAPPVAHQPPVVLPGSPPASNNSHTTNDTHPHKTMRVKHTRDNSMSTFHSTNGGKGRKTKRRPKPATVGRRLVKGVMIPHSASGELFSDTVNSLDSSTHTKESQPSSDPAQSPHSPQHNDPNNNSAHD